MKRPGWVYVFRLAIPFFVVGPVLAADPDYPHGDFSADCTECHDSERWSPAPASKDWKHPQAFPLVGAHRTAACKACHVTLDFKVTPKDCADCHQDPHRGELGADCARCHRPTNFLDRGKQLDDHRATRFPLVGAHATQDCESCHRMQPQGALTWVGLDVACVSCHLADYQGTTDPDHEAAGFPTDCNACHRPTAWDRASIDHDRTGFPLTGRHRTLECSQCHTNGFSGTPTDCYACHADDYDGTTDPNHAQAGFPTDCAQCHNTNSFDDATFAHTSFPLTGAHTTVACASCHTNGYDGTPTDCFACHAADYNGTTDPNHAQAGFPTSCTTCHTTTTWNGAQMPNHDAQYFPIYSGRHQGRWDGCSDCHTQPSNFAVFSCFLCHTQADTDPRHTGVSGYAYDSNLCYQCHPRGEAN